MTRSISPATAAAAAVASGRMDYHERSRLAAAAYYAARLYPGAVGELLHNELLTWEEFGYRLGGGGLIMRVVDQILRTPAGNGPPS